MTLSLDPTTPTADDRRIERDAEAMPRNGPFVPWANPNDPDASTDPADYLLVDEPEPDEAEDGE